MLLTHSPFFVSQPLLYLYLFICVSAIDINIDIRPAVYQLSISASTGRPRRKEITIPRVCCTTNVIIEPPRSLCYTSRRSRPPIRENREDGKRRRGGFRSARFSYVEASSAYVVTTEKTPASESIGTSLRISARSLPAGEAKGPITRP